MHFSKICNEVCTWWSLNIFHIRDDSRNALFGWKTEKCEKNTSKRTQDQLSVYQESYLTTAQYQ